MASIDHCVHFLQFHRKDINKKSARSSDLNQIGIWTKITAPKANKIKHTKLTYPSDAPIFHIALV